VLDRVWPCGRGRWRPLAAAAPSGPGLRPLTIPIRLQPPPPSPPPPARVPRTVWLQCRAGLRGLHRPAGRGPSCRASSGANFFAHQTGAQRVALAPGPLRGTAVHGEQASLNPGANFRPTACQSGLLPLDARTPLEGGGEASVPTRSTRSIRPAPRRRHDPRPAPLPGWPPRPTWPHLLARSAASDWPRPCPPPWRAPPSSD